MPPVYLFTLAEAPASAAGGVDDPIALVALAGGVLMLVYFMILRPRARKGRGDPLAVMPSERSSLAGERAAERQMQSLLVELEQMARQMSAQLDTKAARLEALIRDAESKTAALNAALARAKAERISNSLIAGTLGPEHESGLAALARHRDIYDLADAGESAQAIAQKLRRPAGEVELILALRSTGGAVG